MDEQRRTEVMDAVRRLWLVGGVELHEVDRLPELIEVAESEISDGFDSPEGLLAAALAPEGAPPDGAPAPGTSPRRGSAGRSGPTAEAEAVRRRLWAVFKALTPDPAPESGVPPNGPPI